MTSRERFEAWLKSQGYIRTDDIGPMHDWCAKLWQAAELDMLERLHSLIRNSDSRAEAVAHIEELTE